jgi:acetyl esterase/lipase
MHRLLGWLSILLFPVLGDAQTVSVHEYYGGLELDLYPAGGGELVIFVHGGGFSGGDRSAGRDFCTYLQAAGISCASISYTLSMKGRTGDWSCDGILSEKLRTLQLAANEVWAATSFLTGPGSPLPVSPQRVFLAGSSAGAEAVLHAAFYDRERMRLIDHGLTVDLRYAGVISGAGALVSPHLITEATAVPLLLFHGTADPLVPYGAAPHHFCDPDDSGWLVLFGAGALADHLETIPGGNFTLYRHPGAGHEIAGRYFHRDFERTLRFIRQVSLPLAFRERYQIDKEE